MFDIRENLKRLPDKPGVYLHKDKSGKVIYVGKAVSLKNRVRQYFQTPKRQDAKVRAMVSHIEEFEYIITDTEMEALILENNLIKKYMPQYNVLLRDDKTYPYIKVTMGEVYPRILKTRRVLSDGSKYFGPYTDVGAVNQMIDLLNDVFILKRCSAQNFANGFQPCLNYHIHRCRGICTGGISSEEYRKEIQKAIDYLNGKNKGLMEELERRMTEASANLQFEQAAQYRDQIAAVKAVSEKQKVVLSTTGDLDVVLLSRGQVGVHVIVFFVRQGKHSGRETYHLQAMPEESNAEVITAFLKQYYSPSVMAPKEILLEEELPEADLLEKWLSDLRGSNVKLTIPQKGEKKAFLDLSKRDVIELSKGLDERARNQQEKASAISEALSSFFGFQADNRWRIEAYDISNTNGIDSVGAMVVFENGKPVRKDYRRFKIRTIEGPNDYGSLQEVLYRRLKRGLKGDPSFSKMPDLLLMDGGKNQVAVVEQVLSALNLSIPVAGMVKDDHHRTRGLVYQQEELELRSNPVLFKYIASIQEEVHRFAIDYHRGLRSKKLRKSILDEIDGVGEKRKMALLSAFGSIDAIRQASTEELSKISGMNRSVAEKIHQHLNNSIVK
ncbi:excinuclease ABC subunit UvrC [Sinanaerobacter sp. ZZT-01]|uniref:excinuclease ABC subunit UvrC n=1 Tax=Sinanaerobacter sp. ZZT-01 TaxID=3111540 RepID=UPI002D769D3C|nr:excinuclease ABC subunit UvrC [Sinanaerobacter sp. ZZT-01]WRR92331.1 excinuclease ABC subunit UvrC [Sinanaerobacter sp. ZZT-01]